MDVILTLWIDSTLKKAARVAAAEQDVSMSEWVRNAIEMRLNDDPPSFFENGATKSLQAEKITLDQS